MQLRDALPPALEKILAAPLPLRKMAAKGVVPGAKPQDALLVVALLAQADDAELATAARATLASPPQALLTGALSSRLEPLVLDELARRADAALHARLVQHADIAVETVVLLAGTGDEALTELIATNEERLLAAPAIIEALYKNERTRMSTADRIVELAMRNGIELKGIPAFREIAQALANELIPMPSEEPTYDDLLFHEATQLADDHGDAVQDTHELDELTGEERVRESFAAQDKRFADLTISGRIRRAQVGKASDRMLAIRDQNSLVRRSAAKSDRLTEQEVMLITHNRSTNEDVLRILGSDREWTRHHQIKVNLVMNPRTPFDLASRFVAYLRDHELRLLAGSRDVPGAIVAAAKQQLSRKNRS